LADEGLDSGTGYEALKNPGTTLFATLSDLGAGI
jgi:hypothetical protein